MSTKSKSKPKKNFMIEVNAEKKITPIFINKKDEYDSPIHLYKFKVADLKKSKERTWTVDKKTAIEICDQLRQGFTILNVEQIGNGKNADYKIRGVQ